MTIDDPDRTEAAIRRGMARQREAREAALHSGAGHVGWKVAFTTPGARTAAGVDRSLVGFLTDATRLDSAAAAAIGTWARPTIEAEIALIMDTPLTARSTPAQARAAIAAVAVAIEVVDIDRPLNDTEEVLAGDIFHRHYVVGAPAAARRGGDIGGVRVEARLSDVLIAAEEEPAAVIGNPPDVALAVAAELEAAGMSLNRGDIILAGSAIPLTPVTPGDRLVVRATGLGELELALTG